MNPSFKDQFQNTVDTSLEVIAAFKPNLNASKANQVAVLQEFGKVSSMAHLCVIIGAHSLYR